MALPSDATRRIDLLACPFRSPPLGRDLGLHFLARKDY